MKLALLAGKLGPRVIFRDRQSKVFFLAFGHSFQVDGKSRKGQDIFYLRNVIHALVVNHLFTVNGPLNPQVQEVTKLDRAFHWLPGSRLLLQPVNDVVYLLIGNLYRIMLDSNAMVVAQLHHGFQRNHCFKRYRINVHHFYLRLDKGLQVFIFEHLIQSLGNHKFQSFLQQSSTPNVSLNYGAGSFPFAEPGDLHPAHRPAIGTVYKWVLIG